MKLYFKNIDDTICSSLESHLEGARSEGLTEITLVEAVSDNSEPDFIWCTHYGEVVEKHQYKKSECPYYTSKSSRGKCSNRGSLYSHGEEVTFKV